MRYQVMKTGHKFGHKPLPYGETVSTSKLRASEKELEVFVRRGILKPLPTPKPSSASEDEPGSKG